MNKIYLDDGTVVEANLNMNTWERDTEISPDVFEGNVSNVSYEDENGNIVELGECDFIWRGEHDGVWSFILNPLTDEQKTQRATELNTANIDYLSAMTGIDL